MLNTLRKVRKRMLSKGSFSSYLLYAIGEILLVVAGILIALQVNTWNNNRNNRQQEQEILRQLKREFLDNKQQLEDKMFIREAITASAYKLIGYFEKGFEKLNQDSLDHHLAASMFRPTFDPARGVTDDLLASGKLYLIRNDSLRAAISDWKGKYVDELREEEDLVVQLVVEYYQPFVLKHYQIRRVFDELLDSEIIHKLPLGQQTRNIEKMRSVLQTGQLNDDGSHLLSQDDFADYLYSIILHHQPAQGQSREMMWKIEEVLEMIERSQISGSLSAPR